MFADFDEHAKKGIYTKRAGPFLLGPQLCNSPVKCVSHCLARKDGTDDFYTVKASYFFKIEWRS